MFQPSGWWCRISLAHPQYHWIKPVSYGTTFTRSFCQEHERHDTLTQAPKSWGILGRLDPPDNFMAMINLAKFLGLCMPICSMYINVWYIYLHGWVFFGANIGIHIPAPWSTWDGFLPHQQSRRDIAFTSLIMAAMNLQKCRFANLFVGCPVAIGSVFFVAYSCDLRLKFIMKFCILLVADRLLVMILQNFHGNNYVSFDVFCIFPGGNFVVLSPSFLKQWLKCLPFLDFYRLPYFWSSALCPREKHAHICQPRSVHLWNSLRLLNKSDFSSKTVSPVSVLAACGFR